MEKRTKESKKRLKSIILLIAFLAILFIASTYAWFSTQKDVTISNLTGTVNVAEGLEISLNAKDWSQELDLSKLKITGATNDSYTGNKNISPSELLPVSTTGTGAGTIGATTMQMLSGTNSGSTLKTVVACDESVTQASAPNYPGYFAFDIFLRNTSKANTPNVLQLNHNSSVSVLTDSGNATVGLQNTVRVGLALYGATAEPLDTDTDIIAATTGAGKTISSVAIWEPNSNSHAAYTINYQKRLYNITIVDGEETPTKTYAIASSAIGKTLSDVYKLTSGDVAEQKTLKTTKSTDSYKIKEGVQNLITTTSTGDTATNFTIPANKVSRVRVYVWLEGQDVDCINYASYGGGIDVTLGLVKDATVGSTT